MIGSNRHCIELLHAVSAVLVRIKRSSLGLVAMVLSSASSLGYHVPCGCPICFVGDGGIVAVVVSASWPVWQADSVAVVVPEWCRAQNDTEGQRICCFIPSETKVCTEFLTVEFLTECCELGNLLVFRSEPGMRSAESTSSESLVSMVRSSSSFSVCRSGRSRGIGTCRPPTWFRKVRGV